MGKDRKVKTAPIFGWRIAQQKVTVGRAGQHLSKRLLKRFPQATQ